jgi:putative serine protease PepD
MSSENTPTTPSTPSTPWWISADGTSLTGPTKPQHRRNSRRTVSFNVAIAMAILAGIIGGVAGKSITTNQNTRLISVSNTVERKPDSIAGIAARVSPAVVSISVTSSTGGDTGSGFFINSNGYILTNNHVVQAAAVGNGTITVNLVNGKNYQAKIVGRDSSYDLAVLKIEVTDAPALTLGNSDKVQVGDNVIAIGSPLGLAGTVTSGIISAKNRAVTSGSGSGESSFINALQTDAAINPGNSGGPLVDQSGAVIGVNSAIASLSASYGSQAGSIGLGFAIPINQARKTADQLIKNGTATYPIVGMSLDNRYTGIGAKVVDAPAGILAGGPAAKAGIKPGDIITAIDGVSINNSDEAIVVIRSHNVGDKVTLTVKHGAVIKKITVTLVASTVYTKK